MRKFFKKVKLNINVLFFVITLLTIFFVSFFYYKKTTSQILLMQSNKIKLDKALKNAEVDLKNLKSQDQYKINKDLESEVKSIETTYSKAVSAYEKLLDLKIVTKKTEKFDSVFADILKFMFQ